MYVNVRFPQVKEALEIAALIDFFQRSAHVESFLIGQIHLEHVFNRFAAAAEDVTDHNESLAEELAGL